MSRTVHKFPLKPNAVTKVKLPPNSQVLHADGWEVINAK